MTGKYSIAFLLLLLVSCSSVHFNNVMPQDQKILKNFGPDLIGKYYYSDSVFSVKEKEAIYNAKYFANTFTLYDSITLITADVMISKKQMWYTMEFKTYYKISKFDTTRLSVKHEKEIKTIEGNYVSYAEKTIETLINLGKKDKLIYFKEKYYLNHFVGKKDWDIMQFECNSEDNYSLNLTDDDEKIQLVNSEAERNELFYPIVHVSNEKFIDFIDKGGFRTKIGLKKYK